MYGDLTGDAPDAIGIDVAAGSVELQVPDVPYRVSIDRDIGNVESNVEQNDDARRTIDVQMSAGYVSLNAG